MSTDSLLSRWEVALIEKINEANNINEICCILDSIPSESADEKVETEEMSVLSMLTSQEEKLDKTFWDDETMENIDDDDGMSSETEALTEVMSMLSVLASQEKKSDKAFSDDETDDGMSSESQALTVATEQLRQEIEHAAVKSDEETKYTINDDDDMSFDSQALTESTEQLRQEIEQAAVSFLKPTDTASKKKSKHDKKPRKIPSCCLMPLFRRIAYLRCTTSTVACGSIIIV